MRLVVIVCAVWIVAGLVGGNYSAQFLKDARIERMKQLEEI